MVVRPREQFLGPITQLDKYQGGTVNAFGSEIRNATVVLNSRVTVPTTGPNTGSFWVLDTDPTTPKFTDSNGNTIDLCCGSGTDEDKVGSGTVALVNGTATVIVDLPMDAVLTFSRRTPSGVLGEVYLMSQSTTGFTIESTSDFDNSVINWSWTSPLGNLFWGSGSAVLINGSVAVNVTLPSQAIITFSRHTPDGVLGELYISSQSTSGFVLESSSDFDNSVVNWNWILQPSSVFGSKLLLISGTRDVLATDGYVKVGQRTATTTTTMTLTVELMTTTGTAHAILTDVTASQVIADLSTSSTTGAILTATNLSIISGHIYTVKVILPLVVPGSDFATISYAELT